MAWTCSECAARNKPRAVECENCGANRPVQIVRRHTSIVDLRCAWLNRSDDIDRRCLMNADGRPTLSESGPGYCLWHDYCRSQDTARYATNWDAFLDWWAGWYGVAAAVPYCGETTHFPPEYLFQKVSGAVPTFRVPDPCRVGSCPYAPLGPLKTAPEAKEAIRALFADAPMTRPLL